MPNDSSFRNDIFEALCHSIRNTNEARVSHIISWYMRLLIEDSVFGSGCNCAVAKWHPSRGSRPQPALLRRTLTVSFRRPEMSKAERSHWCIHLSVSLLCYSAHLISGALDDFYVRSISRLYISTCKNKLLRESSLDLNTSSSQIPRYHRWRGRQRAV